jgi:nucleoside-diphosphate-sugar epimerase
MYAITGITGQVGGALARTLLAAHQPVRAVVRDADKAREWAALGCEISFASMNDASALAAAFEGATSQVVTSSISTAAHSIHCKKFYCGHELCPSDTTTHQVPIDTMIYPFLAFIRVTDPRSAQVCTQEKTRHRQLRAFA